MASKLDVVYSLDSDVMDRKIALRRISFFYEHEVIFFKPWQKELSGLSFFIKLILNNERVEAKMKEMNLNVKDVDWGIPVFDNFMMRKKAFYMALRSIIFENKYPEKAIGNFVSEELKRLEEEGNI